MNYVLKGDAAISKDDVVESEGIKVFVDPKAIFFVVGTEMDYVVRAHLLCFILATDIDGY